MNFDEPSKVLLYITTRTTRGQIHKSLQTKKIIPSYYKKVDFEEIFFFVWLFLRPTIRLFAVYLKSDGMSLGVSIMTW